MNQGMEDNQLNLVHYWQLVHDQLWQVITLAVVVTVLAAMIVNAMPSVYKATAVMLLRPERAKTVSMEDMFSLNSSGRAYFNTQQNIIQSRGMLEKVVDQLRLDQSPEFAPSGSRLSWLKSLLKLDEKTLSKAEKRQLLLDAVSKKIEVTSVRHTSLMKLSFESTHPDIAAKFANTLADIYIHDSLEARIELVSQATVWIRQRAAALKQQLRRAQSRLQAFIDREGVVTLGKGTTSLTAQELTDLTDRRLEARAHLREIKQRYGPKHPKFIAARSKLAQAEAALASGKAKSRTQHRTDVRLASLQQDVNSTRDLYKTFVNRLKEANQVRTLKTATARIIDPAIAPLVPIKPKKTLIVIVAFVASLAVGIGLIFLLDMLDTTIRSVEHVESRLGIPALGSVPLLRFIKNMDMAIALEEMTSEDNHQFSESIRTLRTGIMFSVIDNPHKTILVTSSVPGEGKTTVAVNLAIAMGKVERVLLLDADLRRPTVYKYFAITPKANGLSELVAGTEKLEDCLEKSSKYGIDVMLAGMLPPNPLELLSCKHFETVLAKLEKHYDRIIIDSTPVQAVSDALMLSRHAGCVVYVVKADATSDHLVRSCIKRLRQVNAPLTGVVLNQQDIKKANRYGYYGYGGYGGYHSA